MSGLPSGYTQLEYIQSSGTQYIDTKFKPNQNTRVVGVFKTIDTGIPYFWWGARTSSETVNFCTLRVGSGVRSDYGESKVKVLSSPSTEKVLIDQSKNICTYATTSIENEISTFVSQYSLFLFAANTGGQAGYFGHHKMYSCKIYDNETLVRDFVPCKNATGAVGLYDTVEGQFYANAGTGTFTAGPEIPAPEAPSALQTVLAVVLQWAASANVDRYDVYRDGAKLGSTETTQYVDATPEVNQTYVYTVKAVNGGGESAGTSITVYTKSGYFEYKPLIESANFP